MCIRDSINAEYMGNKQNFTKIQMSLKNIALAITLVLFSVAVLAEEDPFMGTYRVEKGCNGWVCGEEKFGSQFYIVCPREGDGQFRIFKDSTGGYTVWLNSLNPYPFAYSFQNINITQTKVINQNELDIWSVQQNKAWWKIVRKGGNKIYVDRGSHAGFACSFSATRISASPPDWNTKQKRESLCVRTNFHRVA
eukprot:TRINITY_DN7808_c0_g1_i3.p1 TRINITY_DN7808_c0_g1~~TRINITY_DN7808_c0_g1_i3.p1  ORF type:complete len:220 (-),score=79.39 TRINITY_DN7808_c0_g1_i3:263-844(-)